MARQPDVKKDVTSLRTTLDYLSEQDGQLLVTTTEVDPNLEMAGIQKTLDGGPAILFENVKGYPGKRLFTNLFASEDRLADIFDVDEPRKFKFKVVDAIRRPLPPREVKDAPCQEVVIDKNIDIWDVVPMIAHTPVDPGRTLGGGNTLITGKYFWGGSHVSFNRMNFRGKDFASFQISPGSHTDMVATEWYKKGPIPMTINMGVPPAVTLMAGAGFMYMVIPKGADELAVAGAIQGSPIDIVKARTIDAYSIANAEIVIEGYLDTTQHVWESEESEKEQKQGVFPFHPEWSGYLGRAYRTYKFQVTGVTHRKQNPIYYPLIVHGYDDHHIDVKVREAAFLELADRICPGLVIDTNIPLGMTDWGGVIFQVRKRRARDDGFQKNILTTAIAASQGMRLAIAVDEDVDIYNAEDIMWALTTRCDPAKNIQIVCPGGMGQTFQPAERSAAEPGAQWVRSESKYEGGIALDCTVPFRYKWAFERARYPVERVDLKRWFAEKDVEKAMNSLGEYARYLSRTGI
ncbi:MAG: UbiD family decarboxylase [Dehalococcoidia bacterium]|nr:UbiD family decarboxylase [Dehalococcoidia bacterium]